MQSFLSCLNNYNGFPDFEDTLLISICPINRRRQFPSHDRHRIAIRMLMRPNTQSSLFTLISEARTRPGTSHTMVFVFRGFCAIYDGQGQLCLSERVRDTVRNRDAATPVAILHR